MDSVSIVLFNVSTQKLILVKQFRPGECSFQALLVRFSCISARIPFHGHGFSWLSLVMACFQRCSREP